MKTLYETCLDTIVKNRMDYSDLPGSIKSVVEKYTEYPGTRLVFADRVDGASILDFAKAIEFLLSEQDIYQIQGDKTSVLRWLSTLQDPTREVSRNWMRMLKCFADVNEQSCQKPRAKAARFEKMIRFLYSNSAILSLWSKKWIYFMNTIQKRFLFILASKESYSLISPEIRKMYAELWGVCPEQHHKKTEWREIHKAIQVQADVAVLNDEFPNFDIDEIWTHSPEPYDIRNNHYWRRSLCKYLQNPHDESDWSTTYDDCGTTYCYKGRPIYEEGTIRTPFRADYAKDWTTGKVVLRQCEEVHITNVEASPFCFSNIYEN